MCQHCQPSCPTEEAVETEELPCTTEEAVMEEEENAPNLASQIYLSFIEGTPRPQTLQHPAAKHGSTPPHDQNASMFVEINVDDESLLVVQKSCWP